jgi:diguanylate cyclase (GGDEF)-like protein
MSDQPLGSTLLPIDVRREMLDSLFGKPKVLVMGFFAHAISSIVAWAATNDIAYLAFIPYFAIIVTYRLYSFATYLREKEGMASHGAIEGWERNYTIGGSGVTLGVGIFASYAIFRHPETIASGIGMGLVGGTMISVVGRNFGSRATAKIMTYCCCLPILFAAIASSFVQQNHLVGLTALPIIVMIVTSIDMSGYLYSLLLGALKTSRQSEIASRKFNDAISSMPNGLVMVDGDQRMIVLNQQAAIMLSIADQEEVSLPDAVANKLKDPATVLAAISRSSSLHEHEDMTYETVDGRWLRFRVRDLNVNDKKFLDEEWGGKQKGAFVLTILDVSSRVASDREMEYLARYDGLTQLANRRYWEESTQRLVAGLPAGELVGLAVLDVDRFKLINDTLGHHIGDEVIRGVADRIRSVGDPRMLAGRLGGDEFVVLFPGVAGIVEAKRLYDRVFSAISTTYVIDGHNVDVRCSGGVIVREKEQFNLSADVSRADMALYKVKRNPNQTWMLFDEALEQEYQTDNRIKTDLPDAIDKRALKVVYQPIYDAKGERVVSAEALCRWEHPDAGYIEPDKFIGMAEEIGVIGKLTEYVLRVACRDCMSWNSDVGVAVNLSSLDLARDGIVETISNALAVYEMPASRLCIEVTETVFVKDFEKTAHTLMTLRNMGVKTSLDDFGTGYSSLSYMHRLPLNRVKIDRSFVVPIVDDPKTQQLFQVVVHMAKGLGFEVVVEGVEDSEQLEHVVSVPGVDMIQGYIFSRDLSNAEMAEMVEVRRPGWKVNVFPALKDVDFLSSVRPQGQTPPDEIYASSGRQFQ